MFLPVPAHPKDKRPLSGCVCDVANKTGTDRCDVIVVCLSAYFVNGSVFLHMLKSYTVKLVFISSINGSMFLHMLKAYAVKLVFICSIYCCAFISEIISSQHTQQIAACRLPMRSL